MPDLEVQPPLQNSHSCRLGEKSSITIGSTLSLNSPAVPLAQLTPNPDRIVRSGAPDYTLVYDIASTESSVFDRLKLSGSLKLSVFGHGGGVRGSRSVESKSNANTLYYVMVAKKEFPWERGSEFALDAYNKELFSGLEANKDWQPLYSRLGSSVVTAVKKSAAVVVVLKFEFSSKLSEDEQKFRINHLLGNKTVSTKANFELGSEGRQEATDYSLSVSTTSIGVGDGDFSPISPDAIDALYQGNVKPILTALTSKELQFKPDDAQVVSYITQPVHVMINDFALSISLRTFFEKMYQFENAPKQALPQEEHEEQEEAAPPPYDEPDFSEKLVSSYNDGKSLQEIIQHVDNDVKFGLRSSAVIQGMFANLLAAIKAKTKFNNSADVFVVGAAMFRLIEANQATEIVRNSDMPSEVADILIESSLPEGAAFILSSKKWPTHKVYSQALAGELLSWKCDDPGAEGHFFIQRSPVDGYFRLRVEKWPASRPYVARWSPHAVFFQDSSDPESIFKLVPRIDPNGTFFSIYSNNRPGYPLFVSNDSRERRLKSNYPAGSIGDEGRISINRAAP